MGNKRMILSPGSLAGGWDRELAEKLKVSRRSLQQYRDSGLLAFTRLGGKILYRSSDIEKLLDGCYREARTRPEEL